MKRALPLTLFWLVPAFFASVASAAAAPAVAQSASPPAVKVVAYYFHVTVRCVTCRTIEQFAKDAIGQGFHQEVSKGIIEWRPVNVQLPENRHYIQDYRLFTRSLVLVKVKDGKQLEWRNLEKIWELVGRKDDFFRYVQGNVKTYLGGT